jgi:DNA-binding PadR family transcriptional regulator
MFSESAEIEKSHGLIAKKIVLYEKGKLLKACADIAILSELIKRSRLSGADIVHLFRSKYGVQMSPGTIYSILQRMEK